MKTRESIANAPDPALAASTLAQFARQVIAVEAAAVGAMAGTIGPAFERAVQMILQCRASILTSGVGKAGHIARKISATMSSTGTPSHFLSPLDALHGDLGAVREGDVLILLSASGESDEMLRMLSLLKKLGHQTIAITKSRANSLGRDAEVVLEMGNIEEACPLGLAPSASTTAMLALGDALALTVMHERKFSRDDFALYHPAGHIGRKLIRVGEAMSFRGDAGNLPIAHEGLTVGAVLKKVSTISRRPGATLLVDDEGNLSGVFTDGDLRRLLEAGGEVLTRVMREVMTRNPKRVGESQLAADAMAVMQHYRIDELPVVDAQGKPIGIIDVQDLVLLRMLDVDTNG